MRAIWHHKLACHLAGSQGSWGAQAEGTSASLLENSGGRNASWKKKQENGSVQVEAPEIHQNSSSKQICFQISLRVFDTAAADFKKWDSVTFSESDCLKAYIYISNVFIHICRFTSVFQGLCLHIHLVIYVFLFSSFSILVISPVFPPHQ